ncbi:MAG: hypothetical protein ABI333_29235 [bacterium]
MRRFTPSALLAAVLTLSGPACPADEPAPPSGPTVSMDFTRSTGFYAAPFPSADLQDTAGHLNLEAFPNRDDIVIFKQIIELGEGDMDGAGLSSAVLFQLTGPIDLSTLPDLHGSVEASSAVFLMDVTEGSPDYLRRLPVTVDFREDGGRFGTPNQLAVLPLQGAPMRGHTRYAAVILRDVLDPLGRRMSAALSMDELRAGAQPAGLPQAAFDEYAAALVALSEAGVDSAEIAGMAVFWTADPQAQTRAVRDDALARPLPQPNAPFALVEVFPEFCTFHSTIDMPVYQEGDPPFTAIGGRWAFDGDTPVLQTHEEANFWITLPRRAVPAQGVPVAVFIRTGGGGDRPLVDRGAHAEPHGDPIEPGSGPALQFARAGYAGVSVDGPHGGLRNVNGGDEQFLMFNLSNPAALRDNIRQSAVEIALVAHILDTTTFDASGCPDADLTPVSFDLAHLALMGHSMGATIAPLVLAVEPLYRAAILSGAGASWIENLMYKQSPLVVRDMAELMLNYEPGALHRHDPALSILQWAADSADPLSYLRDVVREPGARSPVQVLMLQGIVDTYIMPSIANAMSLGLGLDLAGVSLDAPHPELAEFTPLAELLDLVGATTVALPVEGNLTVAGDPVTAVVAQHPEDGIEDGHEVVFQTDPPKYQYQCFLKTLRETGLGYVPAAAPDPRCE